MHDGPLVHRSRAEVDPGAIGKTSCVQYGGDQRELRCPTTSRADPDRAHVAHLQRDHRWPGRCAGRDSRPEGRCGGRRPAGGRSPRGRILDRAPRHPRRRSARPHARAPTVDRGPRRVEPRALRDRPHRPDPDRRARAVLNRCQRRPPADPGGDRDAPPLCGAARCAPHGAQRRRGARRPRAPRAAEALGDRPETLSRVGSGERENCCVALGTRRAAAGRAGAANQERNGEGHGRRSPAAATRFPR